MKKENIFRCIFCLLDLDDKFKSNEHIVPYALGGNLIIKDVCKNCNEHLGAFVDSPLINNFIMDLKRYSLKLKERKGKTVNPFKNIIGLNEGKKYKWMLEEDKLSRIYSVPEVAHKINADGTSSLSVVVDAREPEKAEKIIKRVIEKEKIKGNELIVSKIQANEIIKAESELEFDIKIDILQYKRGLIKIAYEIMYLIYGIEFVNDELSKRIRTFFQPEKIVWEDLNKLAMRGEIGLASERKDSVLLLDDPEKIQIMIFPIDDMTFCELKIFDLFYGNFQIAMKNFGKNPNDGEIFIFDAANREYSRMFVNSYIDRHYQELIHD